MANAFLSLGEALQWAGLILSPILLLPLLVLILPKLFGGVATTLSGLIDRINGGMMVLSMCACMVLIVSQLVAVLLRYVYGLSFSWLDETSIYAFACIFMLGAAATLRNDAHVRVDIMRMRFSDRTKAAIDLIGAFIFIFPICWLILDAAAPTLARSWAGFEKSTQSDGLPILFLFKTLVPILAVLLMAQGLSQALKNALALRGLRPFETAKTMHGAG